MPDDAAPETAQPPPVAPVAAGEPAAGSGPGVPDTASAPPAPSAPARKRPLIERLGMALIALVLAALFVVVAVAAFAGGEPFLGVMGVIGTLMVLWEGGLTLFRG